MLDSSISLDLTSNDFKKSIIRACQDGFRHPIIIVENNVPTLKLTRGPNSPSAPDWKKELEFVKFCINNFINVKKSSKKSPNCTMFVTLDKNAIQYMKGYTEKFKFRIEKVEEQREISGKFHIIPTGAFREANSSEYSAVVLSVDETATSMGKKEASDPILSLGTYHTHPLEAYQKYSICLAYPSVDDYITFLYIYSMGYGNFHIVSTVEGMYVICISPELIKGGGTLEEMRQDLDKYNKSIKQHYGVNYPKCKIRDKIPSRKIKNYLKITNKKPYFTVQFIEWKNAHKPIKVTYKRLNGNCLVQDQQVKMLNI